MRMMTPMPDDLTAEVRHKTEPTRLRGVVLPNEHGSWGILLEPIVAALIVAWSPAAVWIALLFIGGFLLRQPLRVLVADRRSGRKLPRTATAMRYAAAFLLVFAAGLAGTLLSVEPIALYPLAIAAPLGAIQLYYDFGGKSRALLPELTGAIALSSSAAVIALAGGWPSMNAAALWAAFILRMVPSILYIRSRLKLEKGKIANVAASVTVNFAATAAVIALALYGLSSVLTAAIFVILLVRAALGLSHYRKKRKAMHLGIIEVVLGALLVLSIVLSHYLRV